MVLKVSKFQFWSQFGFAKEYILSKYSLNENEK